LRGQGLRQEAYDAFYRASWSLAWTAASYYELAELDCLDGNYRTALDHINRSIGTNGNNLKAKNLKSVVLRNLGHPGEAMQLAATLSKADPLDLWSRNELIELAVLLGKESEVNQRRKDLEAIISGEVQSSLELATYYGNCGSYKEAVEVLALLDISAHKNGSTFPMVYYYLAYYQAAMGNMEEAERYRKLASTMPVDYCFPYRMESLDVLEQAIKMIPADANALYYMGNLLFDSQPKRAISLWERAVEKDGSNAVLFRNLGFAYSKIDTAYERAIGQYEHALQLTQDARMIYELDVLYEMANVDLSKREALFKKSESLKHHRVDVLIRQVLVNIQANKYDKAIELLNDNYFYRWEGGNEVREYYEDAHLLRGISYLNKGKVAKAMADFAAALEFPENLEEGRPEFDEKFARSYYYYGLAQELMGNQGEAQKYYRKAADEQTGNSEFLYYNILACKKLGEIEPARAYSGKLQEFAERGSRDRFFAKFGEKKSEQMKRAEKNYLKGLIDMAAGKSDSAKSDFLEAIELNPGHAWAKAHLNELNQ